MDAMLDAAIRANQAIAGRKSHAGASKAQAHCRGQGLCWGWALKSICQPMPD